MGRHPQLFDDLFMGLSVPEDVVRGRTAHALERLSRSRPELLIEHLEALVELARRDPLPVVRFHLAMLFGNLVIYEDLVGRLEAVLLEMLGDKSVFTRSWAISSLCILGRKNPHQREVILQSLAPHARDKSIAIRSRTQKALMLLVDERQTFPEGWIKSEYLRGI